MKKTACGLRVNRNLQKTCKFIGKKSKFVDFFENFAFFLNFLPKLLVY